MRYISPSYKENIFKDGLNTAIKLNRNPIELVIHPYEMLDKKKYKH